MAETDPVEWSIHGTADISDARRRVADAASSAGLSPERSADVALVLSELVTNGLEHGTGSTAVVRCGVDGDQFALSVSSAASDDLAHPRRQIPGPAAGGRGLYIVARIADSLTVIGADGRVAVECRFDLSAGR
jgi:anti-sigma regulatory factor (Ser/Thr protein kinase)